MFKNIKYHCYKTAPWILVVLFATGWMVQYNWHILFPMRVGDLENIINTSNTKCVPEELLKLGVLLMLKGQYNEADQILRYIIKRPYDNEWFESITLARAILISDAFYSYYTYGPPISNTFSITEIPNISLYDKESVKRKYGVPNIIESNTDGEEKWIYTNDPQCGQMEMTFYRKVLRQYVSKRCGSMFISSYTPDNSLKHLNLPVYAGAKEYGRGNEGMHELKR